MIKGCNKSIVFLKDTGSDYFDEAYFVVKPNVKSTVDIVKEASKIVDSLYEGEKRKRRRGVPKWLFFAFGTAFGCLVTFFIGMLII